MARLRRWHLLIPIALSVVLVGGVAPAYAGTCSATDVSRNRCAQRVTGQIGDGSAELRGVEQRAGSPQRAQRDGSGGGSTNAGTDLAAVYREHFQEGRRQGRNTCHALWVVFGACTDAMPAPADEPAPGPQPAISIEEVATFAPTPAEDSMEPGNRIAVRDLPANFISNAQQEVVSATLFGLPAEVQFTPVGWAWDTGDGSLVEAQTGGGRWERLRQEELTDTKTSHRFEERGWYTVQPTVTYAADYRVDGGAWLPMEGTLDVAGPSYDIRIVTVETRLVRGSCKQYPNDWGCE